MTQLKALLFDLDGTLIDSMPHHHDAWVEWHRRRELTIDAERFFLETAGRSNVEIFTDMLPGRSAGDYAALGAEKEAIYRDIAATRLGLIAGTHELLDRAAGLGLKLAVCTASTPQNIALAYERFGIGDKVQTTVSPADGLRGKPHPDIFLEAAKRLGVDPAECLVFEDAPLGIEAARRAGMKAVALTTTMAAAAFAGFDNVVAVVPDLLDIRLTLPIHQP
jgi:HAD superfamily hydrolase (TIGR01509 family)